MAVRFPVLGSQHKYKHKYITAQIQAIRMSVQIRIEMDDRYFHEVVLTQCRSHTCHREAASEGCQRVELA